MKKGLALSLCLLLMAAAMVFPVPSGALKYSMDSKLLDADASYWGEATNSYSSPGSGMGDVNGDGYSDFLISSPYSSEGGTIAGQTYLILGKTSGWSLDTNLSNADASFWGENAIDLSGTSVAIVGDVNGDGYDDILIGAYQNDDGGNMAGQTYLIFGRTSGWAMDTDLSKANASFWGESANDRSGYVVAGAGDVNGDGYSDFLIGAYRNADGGSYAGQTYLILGKKMGWAMDTDLSNADASFWGEDAYDISGNTVAGVGDVNGDGYEDFLIGAEEDSDSANKAGQTYIILGKASGWAMDTDLSNADASFQGENEDDRSGNSISGVGDVNGDGYDDFLIGAYYNDDGGTDAGQSYLILGKSSGWAMDTDLSKADASFWGEDAGDCGGCSVAGAGDVNGDGYDDILVGACWDEEGGAYAGQTYIILGKVSGWQMDSDLSDGVASFWGESADDVSGGSITGAGDVNGDGYDDILIGAMFNDEGGVRAGQTYLIFPDSNSKPITINSVKVYLDNTYSKEIFNAYKNDTIYIELKGTDGNTSRKDTAVVNVTSNESSPFGISLRLVETGLNTGIYRGNFSVKNWTNENHRWINASYGEAITVCSKQDSSKNAKILINYPIITLYPLNDILFSQEDSEYREHYWTAGGFDLEWTFETNASWLQWSEAEFNLSGTPDNGDVGTYWVKINVSFMKHSYDEHNFTLTVNNTLPDIDTSDITTAVEDQAYSVDYNSTDDGQGTITWHLDTNASEWLSINPVTGVLSGTPTNDYIGQFDINISVDDGNGGWAFANFTLAVTNTNDAPTIITTNNETAYEDLEYSVQYKVDDVDVGDNHAWQLETDAGDWLTLSATGYLSGTPENDDVGIYWVNITVKDFSEASNYTNFTLEVINTNDIPEITSSPNIEATAFLKYVYNVTANDIDKGDVLTYSLDTKPENMSINGETGLLEWIPTVEQEGQNLVVIKVDDGNASVTQVFNITVTIPATFPPRTTLLSPDDGSVVDITTPPLSWSWEDPDSETVLFDVYLSISQMSVETKASSAKVADRISTTSYTPATALEKGTTYYWTAIPFDGENIGSCTNGPWSFKIAEDAVENSVPVITSTPVTTIEVGKQYQYDVNATDEDIGDVLKYSLSEKPDGMVINEGTGLIEWTPSDDQIGNHMVTVQVTDDKVTVSQTFKIRVTKELPPMNNKPTIGTIPDQTIKVGKQFEYQVDASDIDAGDVLSYKLKGQPSGLSISSGGMITWIPTKDQIGEHIIMVNVSDGKDHTTAQFKVTVKEKEEPIPSGLDATMLGIVVAIIIVAVILVAIAVMMMKKKGKGTTTIKETQIPPAEAPIPPTPQQYPVPEQPTQQPPAQGPPPQILPPQQQSPPEHPAPPEPPPQGPQV